MKRVMIVAGEVSGDQHAARLVRDLRAARGDVEFSGIGGEALRREGVHQILHLAQSKQRAHPGNCDDTVLIGCDLPDEGFKLLLQVVQVLGQQVGQQLGLFEIPVPRDG